MFKLFLLSILVPLAVGAQQESQAKKINARTTTVPTSHVPMLSRPDAVATVILAAAGAVK